MVSVVFLALRDSTLGPATEWLSSMAGYFQVQSLDPVGLVIQISLFSQKVFIVVDL